MGGGQPGLGDGCCVQKRMKVAKPTTSACISNSCNELHLPGPSPSSRAAEVPQPVPSRGGTHPDELTVRPSPTGRLPCGGVAAKGALHLFMNKNLNRACLGFPSSMCLTLTSFSTSRRPRPSAIPRGIQMPPRCFSICCTAPREPSPISRHWDKPRVRDEMRWGCTLQEDCFFVWEIALFRQGQQLETNRGRAAI